MLPSLQSNNAWVSGYCFSSMCFDFLRQTETTVHTPSQWHPPRGPQQSCLRATARAKRLWYTALAVDASPPTFMAAPECEPLPSGLEPRSGCDRHMGVSKPLCVDSDELAAGRREGGIILAICDLLTEGKASGSAGARVVSDHFHKYV